nr:PREDICTED: syndecan-2-like [Paralichthys olivaceus]
MYLEGRTSGDLPIDDEDGEDDGSGSGSGDFAYTDAEELLRMFLNFSKTTVSKETVPLQPEPTADSPHIPPTTAADGHVHTATEETTPYKFPDGNNGNEEVPGIGSTTVGYPELSSTTEPTTHVPIDIESEYDDNSLEENIVNKVEDDNEDLGNERSRIYDLEAPEEVMSENLWERTDVLAAVIACGVVGFLCAVFLLLLLAYRMKKKDEGSYDLGDTKVSSTAYQKAPTKEFYA